MASDIRTIDGVAVHTSGTGPAMVLLHANGGDHRDFEGVADRLAERATVHAIDWPGHGASAATDTPSACGFADLLPSLLEQLDGGPFVLLGNSVGGFAAIHAAGKRPDLVRGMVLVDPGGFTPRWPGTLIACRALGARLVVPWAMRVLPRLYLRTRTPEVVRIRDRAVAASQSPEARAVFGAIWRSFTDRRHDARAAAAAASAAGVPTLLMWGRRDPVLLWAVDGRRARRAFPAAQVATFPCGHQPFAEMPEEFLAAIVAFDTSLVGQA
jgi:pimeloyl-ACP methyl ester carboxylesterase